MNIFLDLDGVMADFEGYYLSHFGHAHNAVDDKTMWQAIDSHENFFGSLPLMHGAMDMFEYIQIATGKLPFILTACPRVNYQKHAIDKINWVHEHIHKDLHVLPVMGGKNKCLFMKAPGDLLIDDFDKNLRPWEARGGSTIHHKNCVDTIVKLSTIFKFSA